MKTTRLFPFVITSLAIVYLCTLMLWVQSCTSKPQTPGQPAGSAEIARVKKVGAALGALADEAIILEKQFADAGQIENTFEPKLRAELASAKTAIDAFNSRVAGYTSFDANAKADVLKLAGDALALLEDFNNAGVLHIKNADAQNRARLLIGAALVSVRALQAFVAE